MSDHITGVSVLAGRGDLPLQVAEACRAQNIPVQVILLKGFGDKNLLANFDPTEISMGEVGRLIKLVKRAGSSHVCFVGGVDRPDLKKIKLDFEGARQLPKVVKAASKGDAALLDFIRDFVRGKGFAILSPAKLMEGLETESGGFGTHMPDENALDDIKKGAAVALAMGGFDIAQGAVVCDGYVLALEAAEGTDAMLDRVAGLPQSIRGSEGEPRGVLVKMLKPGQDKQMDQPTIGPRTVEKAHKAGLAGIAIEATHGLIVDRAQTIQMADDLGLFIVGVGADGAVENAG